jgi:hypothetical protein
MKNVSQTGLLAATMLTLVLLFYSHADAQARIVNIPCGQDIDATINSDPKTTSTRFVLGADCVFSASATVKPGHLDEVVCAIPPTFIQRGPAFDPTTRCRVAGPSVPVVFDPIGPSGSLAKVYFEGLEITGGNFDGSSASGGAIHGGKVQDDSRFYGLYIHNNEAAGIQSGRGVYDSIELANNTTVPAAIGFNAAGIKMRHEGIVTRSYVHDTQGNGIWCDNNCVDTVHGTWQALDNVVLNTGRGGIRWEKVPDAGGEAVIERNEVHGAGIEDGRPGISLVDAKDAVVQANVLGNNRGAGIQASDSGRSDRPDLFNIDILNNTLNGEVIKGCQLPPAVVFCAGNTP